jgi:hypothetical protein
VAKGSKKREITKKKSMKRKKSGDFIDLQLEMGRILWIFFPKIIWTMLLSPGSPSLD